MKNQNLSRNLPYGPAPPLSTKRIAHCHLTDVCGRVSEYRLPAKFRKSKLTFEIFPLRLFKNCYQNRSPIIGLTSHDHSFTLVLFSSFGLIGKGYFSAG